MKNLTLVLIGLVFCSFLGCDQLFMTTKSFRELAQEDYLDVVKEQKAYNDFLRKIQKNKPLPPVKPKIAKPDTIKVEPPPPKTAPPEKVMLATTMEVAIQSPDGAYEIISRDILYGDEIADKKNAPKFLKRARKIRAQGLTYDIVNYLPFIKERQGIYMEVVSSPHYEFGDKAVAHKFSSIEKIKELDLGSGKIILVKYIRDKARTLRKGECPDGALLSFSLYQYEDLKKTAETSDDIKAFLEKRDELNINTAKIEKNRKKIEEQKEKIRRAIEKGN